MKKLFLMMTVLAASVCMQAQTKYHDVELNEAKGPVKSIKMEMMGQPVDIQFTQDGKMQREGLADAVYDANGYLQSAKWDMRGQQISVSFKWDGGKLKSQSVNVMGNDFTTSYSYNEQDVPATQEMNMGGQQMTIPYTDYKYDDHGNWISRKVSMMGREMETKRTIEYY